MSSVCDTSLPATWCDAPNFQPRRNGLTPTLLLMHYTGMESAQAALDILCSDQSNVSCHYLVDEDGAIIQMVRESERAWHAGQSHWAGQDDINSCSIGIEIVNEGHAPQLSPFPEQQVVAVTKLAKDIVKRHSILPHNVIGHSDIAPARKKDPGEKFPWARLHKSGIGHFVVPVPVGDDKGFALGDRGDAIAEAQNLFAQYGYLIGTSGHYDEETVHVITAFQRHFRPERVDGRLDNSTLQTLVKLIDTLPKNMTS